MRTDSPPDVGVVIPAGGRGERAGAGSVPKQFRDVAGVPMLLRALRPFMTLPWVRETVVPLPADVVGNPPAWLRDLAGEKVRLVEGGATRARSVANGVAALSAHCTIVLVHDAARPFVEMDTIVRVVEHVRAGRSAIAAVPATDTLKRAGPDGCVRETLDRSAIWRAQTPQGFPRAVLTQVYDAHEGGLDATVFTDEASLVEAAGFPVVLVPDSEWNVKVTSQKDFDVAEALATR